MKKRMLSLLLTIVMVVTLLPTVALAEGEHSHSLCRANSCTADHNGDDQANDHGDVSFGSVADENALIDAAASGRSVYLTDDIELTATLEISNDLTLCLNGHSITRGTNAQGSTTITVASGGSLTITDCGTDVRYGYIDANYLWNADETVPNGATKCDLKGGIINSNASAAIYDSGCVYVEGGAFTLYGGNLSGSKCDVVSVASGTFTMYGGNITGNTEKGVYVKNSGDFIMNGGTISYNGARGVFVAGGEFTMDNGNITNNIIGSSSDGGGVRVNSGKFTMNGGTISGNWAADEGGGVYVYDDEFTMNGGTITNNEARRDGGGVCVSSGEFNMNGGTITGNTTGRLGGGVYFSGDTFNLSGGIITGNYKGSESSAANNVELISGRRITFPRTLSAGTKIGVTAGLRSFTSGGSAYVKNFKSDNPAYYVVVYGDNLKLEVAPTCDINPEGATNGTFTVMVGDSTPTSEATTATAGATVTITATPDEGYEVDTVAVYKTGDESSTVEVTDNKFEMPAHDVTVSVTFRLIHQHILCQTNGCTLDHNGDAAGSGHEAEDKITFIAVSTQDDLQYYATNGGNYCLANDIELTSTITVTGDLTLCLNGNKISPADAFTGNAFNVSGTLVLTDCKDTGAITGFTSSCINNSGIFTLYAGKITYNTGWGVFNNGGTFSMTGGEISHNCHNAAESATKTGVMNSGGTFTMNGGKITENNGDGVMNNSRYSKFTMNDGEISGNSGNGVYNPRTFTMNDGEISGNRGDGVYTTGTFSMNGGEISGNARGVMYENGVARVSGAPVIKDNTNGNFCDHQGGSWLEVSGALTDGADIGVTLAEKFGVAAEPDAYVDNPVAASDYIRYFHSDDEGLEIFADDQNILIGNNIIEEPTAANGYTVKTNDDANADYQWYKISSHNVDAARGDHGEGVYDAETGLWTPVLNDELDYEYCAVSMSPKDVLIVEFEDEVPGEVSLSSDDADHTMTRDGEKYVFKALGNSMQHLVVEPDAPDAPLPRAKATLLKAEDLNGQTAAALKTRSLATGTYACQVTWDYMNTPEYAYDDWVIQSASVEYTKPASSGGSYTPTYAILTQARANGEVNTSRPYAAVGSAVTITAIPQEGYVVDTVTVTDSQGNNIKVTAGSDGTYTFTMPERSVQVAATFVPDGSYATCSSDSSCPMHGYTDLNSEAWYHDGIHYCVDNGLMSGTGEGQFSPDAETTRAMIIMMLWRLDGSPVVDDALDFADVAEGQWYTEAIRWAKSKGIAGGYGNGYFGTNDAITREQVVTILWRYAQQKSLDVSVGENTDIQSFDDATDVANYAVPAMQWACGSGVVGGKNNADGTGLILDPVGKGTRAQIATMLMRFCENSLK